MNQMDTSVNLYLLWPRNAIEIDSITFLSIADHTMASNWLITIDSYRKMVVEIDALRA